MLNIECKVCNTHYRLPEKRANDKGRFQAKCNKCDNLIVIDFANRKSLTKSSWEDLLPENVLYGKPLHKEILGNFKKLYPMPHVALKARQLLKTDPALAGRIIKAANSAYFGLSGKVASIQHAAALLGTRLLVQIINMVSHSKMLGGTIPGYGADSGLMWRHSLAIAIGSDFIAKKMAPEYSGEAFLAGLLHDAGKIILDHYILERQASFKILQESERSTLEAEKLVFDFDHAEISGDLCGHWGLPDFVAEAVCFHHFPSKSRANMLSYIVHAADAIANHTKATISDIDLEDLDSNTLNFLQLEGIKLQDVAHQILEAVETLEDDTY